MASSAPPAAFLDVELASRFGATLARRRRLPASYRPGALEAQLDELSVLAQERVALEAGLVPPGPPRARVVDRGEWVAANVATVERLLGPAMAKMAEHRRFTPPAALERISRQSSAAQLGSVLAWLSGRVLGQYDLLVGEEASVDEDVISYVGPNIVALEQRHGFDPDQFRLWLALHETAHRAQFTAVDWVRPYVLSLIDQVVSSIAVDSSAMLSNLLRSVRSVVESKSEVAELGLAALVASPEQLDALRRLTALMSVLEGHGEVVMDEAATDQVPDPTDVVVLRSVPRPLAARAIRRWLKRERGGHQPTAAEVERVFEVVALASRSTELAGGGRVLRTAGRLRYQQL